MLDVILQISLSFLLCHFLSTVVLNFLAKKSQLNIVCWHTNELKFHRFYIVKLLCGGLSTQFGSCRNDFSTTFCAKIIPKLIYALQSEVGIENA